MSVPRVSKETPGAQRTPHNVQIPGMPGAGPGQGTEGWEAGPSHPVALPSKQPVLELPQDILGESPSQHTAQSGLAGLRHPGEPAWLGAGRADSRHPRSRPGTRHSQDPRSLGVRAPARRLRDSRRPTQPCWPPVCSSIKWGFEYPRGVSEKTQTEYLGLCLMRRRETLSVRSCLPLCACPLHVLGTFSHLSLQKPHHQ